MKTRLPIFHLFLSLLVASLIFTTAQFGLLVQPIAQAQHLTHAIRAGAIAFSQDLRPQNLNQSNSQKLAKDWLEVAENLRLNQENTHMRQLLSAPLPSSWKFIPARVVGKGDNLLFIDEGSQAGVKPGMTVIVTDVDHPSRSGVLVGKISYVSPGESRVLLPTHKDSHFAVQIASSQTQALRGKGIAVGTGSKIQIEEILNNEQVNASDLVMTNTGSLAPGLLVGLLASPTKDPSGLYQTASILPLLDPYQLDYVFVISQFEINLPPPGRGG